jgi:hypothetical protein
MLNSCGVRLVFFFAGRHQVQGASQHKDLTVEDPNTRFMDPETKVAVTEGYNSPVISIHTNSLTW